MKFDTQKLIAVTGTGLAFRYAVSSFIILQLFQFIFDGKWSIFVMVACLFYSAFIWGMECQKQATEYHEENDWRIQK